MAQPACCWCVHQQSLPLSTRQPAPGAAAQGLDPGPPSGLGLETTGGPRRLAARRETGQECRVSRAAVAVAAAAAPARLPLARRRRGGARSPAGSSGWSPAGP
eukprot:5812793-Heterocapsa_arctica.AAC.1